MRVDFFAYAFPDEAAGRACGQGMRRLQAGGLAANTGRGGGRGKKRRTPPRTSGDGGCLNLGDGKEHGGLRACSDQIMRGRLGERVKVPDPRILTHPPIRTHIGKKEVGGCRAGNRSRAGL